MKKYKHYIIGVILLIIGLALGWVLKPSTDNTETEHHGHLKTDITNESDRDQIWTCSMHPQIRQNQPGVCPICEMDLIPLDNSMGNEDPTILRMSAESAKLAQIETYIVGEPKRMNGKNEAGTSYNSIKVDGRIEIDERTIKSQTAHLSGRLDKMNVTFKGQYISKGQAIAVVYSTELLAASQELITAAQFNDRVEGLEEAATQKLKNWKISDTQIQQILTNGKPIETVTIFADHSGYVLEKKLSQGDYVKQGQALYTLGSTNNLWLLFDVFESDLSNIKKGDKVTFETTSLPNKEFNTKVSYIDPLLNSSTRTATVRAEIVNTKSQLKPGMLIKGIISKSESKPLNNKNSTIVVPNTAILWTGDRSVVFVQLPDLEVPTYQYREVEIGERSGNQTRVVSGLENGEEIVTHGAFAIDASAQLNNNMSMMNKHVKVKKDETSDIVPNFLEDTPPEFKDQLEQSIAKYIDLKNALVDTDQTKASLSADSFISSLKNIDMTLLKGEAHVYWMEQLKVMDSHGMLIVSSVEVEDQRNQFNFLSQAVINSVKAFGTSDKTYFIQYCPMVNGNQGADWISTEEQIRNPYFGDKMMKCGSVKLTVGKSL